MLRNLVAAAAALATASMTVDAAATARKYKTDAKRVDAPGVLNVHIIAHTHDDVGWLKTVDEYYAGLNNTIQHAGVTHILSSTIDSLLKNPDRKFIYVEQAFFQRWYAEQSPAMQVTVQQLVSEGRLSFVNGGWCMHDEANTVYTDMVDQTQLGHRFIQSEFGSEALPSVTWQIDPFGHSGAQASLFSSPAAGFEALFVSRADYQDIQQRTANKSLEYVWTASQSLGQSASTFFSIMNSGLHLYFPLPGLCWDALNCNDPEIQDDASLDDYNVADVVARTLYQAASQQENYVGDIYMTQGFDFNYEYAEEWFINIDKWINYVNANTSIHGVNMFYSTPQAYARTKISYPYTWPSKYNDDGFPYADGPHSYWTGYFTSRPALKGYIRDSSSYFQAAKQIQAVNKPMGDLDPANPLYVLARAMGVAQHHDAVAGTEQQHVAYDYAKRIARGRLAADKYVTAAIPALLNAVPAPATATCDLANATICPALESLQATTIYIYNSQSQARTDVPITIPVGIGANVSTYAVYRGLPSSNVQVAAQTLPLSAADVSLRTEYYSYTPSGPASNTMWLVFMADLPAAGPVAYTLVPASSIEEAPMTAHSVVKTMKTGADAQLRGKGKGKHATKKSSASDADVVVGDQTLTNGVISLTIASATGLLSAFSSTAPAGGVPAMPLTQTWFWYNASVGNDVDGQASGAYIFRPNSSVAQPVSGNAATVTLITGPLVNEARQVVADGWLTQVTRLYAGAQTFDYEYSVGPVPHSDGLGKEVVSRLSITGSPSFVTNGTWTTDSNGRDMYKRIRDYRASWHANIHEPVAGNYYPVNSAIQTVDVSSGLSLFIVNDRSQGGGSIVDGSIELMVHRRLQADDGRGVGEPLSEPGVDGNGLIVRGVHRVGLVVGSAAASVRRTAVQDVALFRPVIAYGVASVPTSMATVNASALAAPLPANLHLLSFQSLASTSFIVRLAHLYGVGEDAVLSSNVTVDLASIFNAAVVAPFTSCDEMTLPGGQVLAEVAGRTVYNTVDVISGEATQIALPAVEEGTGVVEGGLLASMPVTITPLQIRTFVCDTA